MPSFCRHNRLVHNCPICTREQDLELRPVLSPGGSARGREGSAVRRAPAGARTRTGGSRSPGVTVRKLIRGGDDGYRSELLPGLKSGADAERLAGELAWGAARLATLTAAPPGCYAEIADPAGPLEERTWLAFLTAYLGPLDGPDPFASIAAVRSPWSIDGALGSDHAAGLSDAEIGPRGAHGARSGARTLEAYRAWAMRSGSQALGIGGDPAWTPERRFARAFERLALPALERGVRFDFLVTLGFTGAYELRPESLAFGGSDPVTLAAKRLLGIGDPLLLERRAGALAERCQVPLAALDAGFFNWEQGAARARLGMAPELEAEPGVLDAVRSALGL